MAANRPHSQQSKHSRASSDLSLLRGAAAEHYRPSTRSPRLGSFANGLSNTIVEAGTETPQQAFSNMLRTPGIRLDRTATDSFLDMDESDAESLRNSEDIPILLRHDESSGGRNTKVTTGVAFGDLVDRLLALKMSRADNNFLEIFLCLYRKFAAPGELFSAILFRLDKVRDDKSAHYLTKTATQLRIIEVVARWVSLYPGDFARPATRRNLEDFIRHLSTEPIFCTAARQIKQHLEHNVMEDDDTGWAKSDDVADREASKVLSKDNPRSMSDISNGVSSLYLDEVDLRPSGSSDLSIIDRSSSFVSYQSFDDYEREASTMEPTDVLPMNKFRYHIFMDIPEDHIAEELTRIDWVMFSSIRVRDFVRHVSLPLDQRAKCKSLKNVNRMINHFNHVAKWTANLTLLRDKPKHRAQMLEKFMAIAGKLRRLNNYNGLAAILAGINGTAVHRLTQTWALVPPDKQRAFAKLGILMGTQKSHFAYRLAWENSPLPRIPYMPLHRRDLVSAEEGSKTFVGPEGDRVNWKKFEVLGEVILPIMKSQSTPYPNQTRHDAARELILDCRMPTDEEVCCHAHCRDVTLRPRADPHPSPGDLPAQRAGGEHVGWRRRPVQEEVPLVRKVVPAGQDEHVYDLTMIWRGMDGWLRRRRFWLQGVFIVFDFAQIPRALVCCEQEMREAAMPRDGPPPSWTPGRSSNTTLCHTGTQYSSTYIHTYIHAGWGGKEAPGGVLDFHDCFCSCCYESVVGEAL